MSRHDTTVSIAGYRLCDGRAGKGAGPGLLGFDRDVPFGRRVGSSERVMLVSTTVAGNWYPMPAASPRAGMAHPMRRDKFEHRPTRIEPVTFKHGGIVGAEDNPDDPAILDAATIAELCEEGGEFLAELVDAFKAEPLKQLSDLAQALAKGDTDAAARIAHTVKGKEVSKLARD